MIKLTSNKIILTDFEHFDIKSILECGQVFRYATTSTGYEVYSLDKYAQIQQQKAVITITTDDIQYFYNYFDLDRDYSIICDKVSSYSEVMSRAVQYGKGIRILNQDLVEMIFSYIISANNNIKRIQGIIDRLCTRLGSATKYGYAFPTIESLASADISLLKELGCGYRADYIHTTANVMLNGFDLAGIRAMSTDKARQRLLELKGIGNKVADCILLFGLRRADVFPVDTWVQKIYHAYFEQGHKTTEISKFFVDLFGEYSGYAQQYLFYFQRESIAKQGKIS